MALRLTGTPSTTPDVAAFDVARDAVARLHRRDLAGYRALFADAAAADDRHARYAQRKALVEAALEAGRTVRAAHLPELYATAAGQLLAVLEEEPREPVLLNYAGVLFYELWALDAADALFSAAQRLDPELPEVAGNLAEVARRRRSGGAVRLPPAIRVALRELGERARRLAARATPATGLTLSLCMIVRDEEEMLGRCLAAVAPAVDEIVVVDTGSSDRTIEIARSFGARVLEREWTGSFADARNASFDAATGDWLLYLDADEVVVAEDVAALRALTGQTWREAFWFNEINYTGELGDGTATKHLALRAFRNRPEYRFEGRLHEQITDPLPLHLPERFGMLDVRIEHFGYLGAVRDAKEKSRRNVELLERQRQEGRTDLFFHFNLGSEYFAIDDVERACAEFERAWELVERDPEAGKRSFVPLLAGRSVAALRACGRLEQAFDRAAAALERFPSFTDLVYEQGLVRRSQERYDEAIALFERCLAMGDAPAGYTSTVGTGTFLPTIALAELRLARGEVDVAVAMLDACLGEHPGFFGLVLPFASALLAQGVAPEEVVARVEARVARLTPTVRFVLGVALYEAGETAAAEAQYRALLERHPDRGAARVALAESLLSQRRWAEAAAEAAKLADGAPHAAAARRSELFARIVAGDLAGADAVLARGAATGLPAHERELFAAWRDAAAGRPGDAVLPLEAVPLLAVTLEALLRVEEVDAFAVLVPLLDRTPIPPREQRELRAAMYLRRGFLASAAEEWMAACESDPADARALVGLAQIAVAQRMPDEALEFAREAVAAAPDDPRAVRLLERLEPLAA